MKITLSTNDLRRLSMVSSGRGVAALVFEWLAIAAAIVLCESAGRPVLLMALTTVWIGARLHALGVLMHEATHHRLVEARWLNEALGEVFCGWPLFVSLESYRQNHLAHHQNVNSALDPDWVRKQKPDWIFPKTRLQLAWLLMRDALGLNLFDHLRGACVSLGRHLRNRFRGLAPAALVLASANLDLASACPSDTQHRRALRLEREPSGRDPNNVRVLLRGLIPRPS